MIERSFFADQIVIRDTILKARTIDLAVYRRIVAPFYSMRYRVMCGLPVTSKQAKWINDVRKRLGLNRHRFG